MNKKLSPRLIIIPGSVASRANWLDQEILASKLGFEYHFVHLHKYFNDNTDNIHSENIIAEAPDIEAAANVLFQELENIISQNPDRQNIIACHSLGGMLLLKILYDMEKYKDSESFARIFASKIVFTQVPLSFSEKVYKNFISKIQILNFATSLNRKLLYAPVEKALRWIKNNTENKRADLIIMQKFCDLGVQDNFVLFILSFISILVNLGLMHNTFWSVDKSESDNIFGYYKFWEEFSVDKLSKLIQNANINSSNFIFTTGTFDLFCDPSLTLKLANEIKAEVRNFPWSFHSPQHMTWSQFEYNKILFSHR